MNAPRIGPRQGLLCALLLTVAACASPFERRLARMEARVDSLATTLTAVTTHLNRTGGQAGPARADSVAVGVAGVAAEGRPDALVTIVEFTDYQCPFCARHVRQTLPELRRKYIATGKVRYVIRDLPLSIHPFARPFASAARCAATQAPDKYWAFHDSLFARQRSFSAAIPLEVARSVGLETPRFSACLAAHRFEAQIEADIREAEALGLTGTPALIIGRTAAGPTMRGEVVRGAFPIAAFDAVIGRALAAPSPRP